MAESIFDLDATALLPAPLRVKVGEDVLTSSTDLPSRLMLRITRWFAAWRAFARGESEDLDDEELFALVVEAWHVTPDQAHNYGHDVCLELLSFLVLRRQDRKPTTSS